ncbi:hypothetical protein Tco_0811521 [Tanacetum coccineum]
MLTNSCLGGIMVSLIFLEGLEEEALVEVIVELFEEDEVEDMKFESAQSNTTAKLPILKLTQKNGTSVTKMLVPITAEEKTNKKNDVKARRLLLMALSNEHQLTFSQYNDAKTMFAAIETRFRESLDSIFNRLQKIVSRLAILVWMNKAEIETMSIDDLYNNFKIIEQSVKKYVGASSGAQNLAFMTAPSTSSTNDVNTAKPAYEVSIVSPNVNAASPHDLEKIHKDDLEAMDLKWQLSLLSMRAKRYFQRTGKKIFINANDTAGYDKSNSDMAEEQVQTNMALMAFSGSEIYNDKTCSKTCLKNYETLKKQCDDLIVKLNQTKITTATYKRGLATVEEQLITYRKNVVLFSEEVAVLKREVACKDYEINVLKTSKDLHKLLGSQITDKSKKGLGYNFVPPSYPLIYNRPKKLDLSYSGFDEFNEPEFKSYGSEDSKKWSLTLFVDNNKSGWF